MKSRFCIADNTGKRLGVGDGHGSRPPNLNPPPRRGEEIRAGEQTRVTTRRRFSSRSVPVQGRAKALTGNSRSATID